LRRIGSGAGMKKIVYTTHSRNQIKLRNILEKDIEKTLKNPLSIQKSESNRKVAQKIYNIEGKKNLLRIIFAETENQIEVITAYRTTKIMKYLKGN
jgi:hypothetical protein